MTGAHTQGENLTSIGICYVGGLDNNMKPKDTLTERQSETLKQVVKEFKAMFPQATVHGHNEFANKACPSFDVQAWLKANKL
jgi:N-acetylmuramoyl-L-alanine amidase